VTPAQVLRGAADYLRRHEVDAPEATAERLLTHVLGTDRAGLAARSDGLTTAEAKRFGRALCGRCTGKPTQHITGEAGFRHLVVMVRPGVFIPRPETEIVVDHLLASIADIHEPRVIDVGTGTGAIALSVKQERPDAHVVAIDRSPEAVDLARENASALGLDVEVVEGDLLAPIPVPPAERVDAIVSNPPYIDADGYGSLPSEVKADPVEALVGDISLYEDLAQQAFARLRPGGTLAVEIGETQGSLVSSVFVTAGFRNVRVSADLARRDRVVVGITEPERTRPP
jgi:release factor glutamine methyltransferase